MNVEVLHKNIGVTATSMGIYTAYRVEYKEYCSEFTPKDGEKTLAMVEKRIQRELNHIRSNNMEKISKKDVSCILETFMYTLKTALYANTTESVLP